MFRRKDRIEVKTPEQILAAIDTEWHATVAALAHPAVIEHLRRLIDGVRALGYTYLDLRRERNSVRLPDKVIITCAVTGSGDSTGISDKVPVTPEQIAESAIDAARAGAAVVEAQPGEYVIEAEGTPGRVAALTAWLAEPAEPPTPRMNNRPSRARTSARPVAIRSIWSVSRTLATNCSGHNI